MEERERVEWRDGWKDERGPAFQIIPYLTIKYARKGFRVSQKNEVLLFLGVLWCFSVQTD